jgi:hypothetical protein
MLKPKYLVKVFGTEYDTHRVDFCTFGEYRFLFWAKWKGINQALNYFDEYVLYGGTSKLKNIGFEIIKDGIIIITKLIKE